MEILFIFEFFFFFHIYNASISDTDTSEMSGGIPWSIFTLMSFRFLTRSKMSVDFVYLGVFLKFLALIHEKWVDAGFTLESFPHLNIIFRHQHNWDKWSLSLLGDLFHIYAVSISDSNMDNHIVIANVYSIYSDLVNKYSNLFVIQSWVVTRWLYKLSILVNSNYKGEEKQVKS